jgi:hypothetical protein
MTSKCFVGLAALLLLGAAHPALAAPEPLVVTPMADPDPNFVPPAPEHKTTRAHRARSDEDLTLDQAFENLGRVTGQLALMGEQHSKQTGEDWQAKAREQVERMREQADAPQN